MNRREIERLDRDLSGFIESMIADMGRPERRRAMKWYIVGLLLDGERKSIEPMAARLVDSASEIEAMRQRLQQAVSVSTWGDEEMFRRVARKLDGELPGVEAMVVDDTVFPKKGPHSVGVQRQYSGTLGRIDNCQVAVSLHLAGEAGSGCIGMRLFLPEAWANDAARRAKVGVPDGTSFEHKWQIALVQIDNALRWGVRKHVVLADAGYGDCSEFRQGLIERGLHYIVGVQSGHCVWPPGVEPTPPTDDGGPGRPRTYWTASADPVRIEELACSIPYEQYRTVTWREGSKGIQRSRFVALRVCPAENYRRGKAKPPQATHWLLCQWPTDKDSPAKFWLSNLPETTSLVSLVRFAKLRWRVERDYQELKQEIGLDHFEGRSWRGFHHHATLCAVAHAFLALQRALFPPEILALDASDGAASSSGGRLALDRHLPALPQAGPSGCATARTLTDVIESY
jgi:SRSO17 transposase